MRDRRSRGLKSSQRTISHLLPAKSPPESLYVHMLIEDASLGIIPIPRLASDAFEINLRPESEAVESLIVAALSRVNGSYRDELAWVVHDCFQECTGVLTAFGEAAYEIAYMSDEATAREVAFELVPVQSGTYRWHRGNLVQVVPEGVAESRGSPGDPRGRRPSSSL